MGPFDKKNSIPFRLFLPAVFILFIVVLMTVFIAWSTWQNVDRDRNNAVEQLLREVDILVHVMHGDVAAHAEQEGTLNTIIEKAARKMEKWENLAYIYFFDSRSGNILYARNARGLKIQETDLRGNTSRTRREMVKNIDGVFVLEVIRQMEIPDTTNRSAVEILEKKTPLSAGTVKKGPVTFVSVCMGLTMDSYGRARKADIHHAGIMIGILLLLGAGTIFFIFIIQNYLRDLNRMQHLQRQMQKNEKFAAIGQLSAGVAHEIRNPLSSIRGFAGFFVHFFNDNDEYREYASIMVAELDRINGVITNLITFANPLQLKLKKVYSKDLVDHMLRLIEGDSRSAGVFIITDVDNAMPPLFMDEDQMKQVLLNLLINALNVLLPGQKIIVGAAAPKKGEGGYFWVEDDGPGIPRADQQRIFDPFYSGGGKGSGLGLAIVNKIVENHGGTISLESPAPGRPRGTRFTIFLPGGA